MATTSNPKAADPRAIFATSPMTARQIVAIAVCVLLNALDGFDVLSISFASPGISVEWGIDRAALGLVLSMELIGMALGSLALGQVADRIGRQMTTLLCLIVMALGMMATTQIADLRMLAAARLFTGLGIGGMLATTNALVAEYANAKWRSACVAIMAAGYPLGAIIGGAMATHLLQNGGWRDVFWLGAGMTALCLPLIYLLPEPVGTLLERRPANLLDRVNQSLRKLGHAAISVLPPPDDKAPTPKISALFSADLRWTTLLLTAAYFLHIITFYFILKWVPKIVVDMGFSPSLAGGVLVLSALSVRLPLRRLLTLTMLASAIMIAVFGQVGPDLAQLKLAAAAGGFFTNASVVGLYALVAASFPTSVRAGGTGFVIGIGRGGAALSPIIGGLLFSAGLSLPGVAGVIALGSLGAALVLAALPKSQA
jgi:MFS family permease